MKGLDKKQKWTLVLTLLIMGIMIVVNNIESNKVKDTIKCKTENLSYNLNKDVELKSTVNENISTDYYTLGNTFKFSVSRYDIGFKDSIISDIKNDFKDLGKFGEYSKNDLNWLTIKFKDIPLSNGGCFLLETDASIYYIEANSNKEDILDIIDNMLLENERGQSINYLVSELNIEEPVKENVVPIQKEENTNVVITDSLNGVSNKSKFLVHFSKKLDPMEVVKVYTDIKCEDNSLVFTWNEAYETEDGMDVIVKGDANLLLCQDRLDYDILQSDWGNASRLYMKVLDENNLDKSYIIPITFMNEIQAPITFSSNGKDIEWFSVDEADSYRVYMSELDREGNLGRSQGYINEKPKLLASVSKDTNKFSVSETNKNYRFYVTAVKTVEETSELEEGLEASETEASEEVSEDLDSVEEVSEPKAIESLFSDEICLSNIENRVIKENITKNPLDFENVLEHQEMKQIKYTKTSVDQRTELELKRVEDNGVYRYPLSVVPHYTMTGSYPSDIDKVVWTEEEMGSRSLVLDHSNENQNNKINILISKAKNQVDDLSNGKSTSEYLNIINFDNEYERYLGNALISNQDVLSLDGLNRLNDKAYLNEVLEDVRSKNILLDELEVITYNSDNNTLNITYKEKTSKDVLDKFMSFSKEMYEVNDIKGLITWVKELQVGGNVEELVSSFKEKGYTQETINTYLLDIILKSNSIPSKIVTGEKSGEDYVWNLFKLDNTWYQYDMNDDLTSKKEYVTELNIESLYDTDVNSDVKNTWYTDRDLIAASEEDLINIICNRYAELDKIIIKLDKGFTFEYSDEFGEKLVKQLSNFGYTVSENFSYSVVGNYVMIMK